MGAGLEPGACQGGTDTESGVARYVGPAELLLTGEAPALQALLLSGHRALGALHSAAIAPSSGQQPPLQLTGAQNGNLHEGPAKICMRGFHRCMGVSPPCSSQVCALVTRMRDLLRCMIKSHRCMRDLQRRVRTLPRCMKDL
ncbi:hypothetical protein DUNSADRAFT_7258 [Dunaliella salina]|uniref:Encoded protein n=1 Tax=Dunaliella salina TaxID=3046 RepID=A0ABQ7GLM5_DUNSA|nr:hypothetical protein DUNSADRAFT_7258 [Dunaliella salina]|eukprot:KAF5835519.1 hypothetical protein DUNSADRAFT_7258 [Dunaliella salina]